MVEEKTTLRKKIEFIIVKRANIKKKQVKSDNNLKSLTGNNLFKLSHILVDLQEEFDLEKDYFDITKLYDLFATIDDLETYVMEKQKVTA